MAETMIGVFSTRELAENAISELEDKGYNVKDISIIMKEGEERDRLARNTGANVSGNVAAGAATGAVTSSTNHYRTHRQRREESPWNRRSA